jgi:uncharacterized delta-60 repeat protein
MAFWRWIRALGIGGTAGLMTRAVALAAAGDLDPSFGTDGRVLVQISTSQERLNSVLVQPDGKIVVGGTQFAAGEGHFLLARFDAGGGLDASFGSGGIVTTVVAGASEGLTNLLQQSDGRIVAVGVSGDDLALVRYQTDGSLDASFGGSGKVVSPIGPGRGVIYDALLQPDGKIVVVGGSLDSPTSMALARFNPDGSVDADFGSAGEVLTNVSVFSDFGLSAALQPDGRIIVACNVGAEMAIVRYEADGSLDGSFGSGGIALGGALPYPRTLALQADGKIVVGGDGSDGPGGTDFNVKLWRLNADGSPDMSFNGGAVVTTVLGPMEDLALSVLVQPSGRILLVGHTTTSAFFSAQFAVVRYTSDGSLDTGFGSDGVATTSIDGFARDLASAAVLQPDGKIVVAGEHYLPPEGDLAVARYFGNLCGDTSLEAGEQCDDGNSADGDCCTAVCHFDAVAAPCADDANACTTDQCDGAGSCQHDDVVCAACEMCDSGLGCVGRPRPTCAAPGPDGRAALALTDRSRDAGDVARWRWRTRTPAGNVGDPTATDDYALCIYDGPEEALWLAAEAPAGDLCNGAPCWSALGQPPFTAGARYSDGERTPDGISALSLGADAGEATNITLKARGDLLDLPALDTLQLPVRVQIQRSGEACWEATFEAPRVNTAERFQATVK